MNIQTYILVIGDKTASGSDANTRVAFKICASFTKYITHINDEHIDGSDNLDIIMPMYNLIELTDWQLFRHFRSLWQFKRDEQNMNNGNPVDVTTADSSSFK